MKTSCLINNFNYANHINDAIESALNQTIPFDEIIVIDDGSTDDSPEIISRRYGGNAKIKIISKINQGQLSSFNEGFSNSSGDIIFFLDADDTYEPSYLKEALTFYELHSHCDFLYCALQTFGHSSELIRSFGRDRQLGFSILATLYLRKWIGSPTSGISMRRRILEKILPMPDDFLNDWRVRADDCLVWGASLAGAYKCYLDKRLVGYRIHDNNNFNRRTFNYTYRIKRIIAVNRLFNYFIEINNLENKAHFHKLIKYEFRTIQKPSIKNLLDYIRITRMIEAGLGKKLETYTSLFCSWLSRNSS